MMIFPSSSTHFTLLTELNLTVPKARPEAHTFDFITGEGERPCVCVCLLLVRACVCVCFVLGAYFLY